MGSGPAEPPAVPTSSFPSPVSVPFSLWSRYSRITLMTWTMARMSDPKASEPVWYLGKPLWLDTENPKELVVLLQGRTGARGQRLRRGGRRACRRVS